MADELREILGRYLGFRDEKSRIERYLTEKCKHVAYVLPKYHCELNPTQCN